MNRKIYDEQVTVDQDLDAALKRAFVNNLLVYNHCLGLLYKNPDQSFPTLRKQATKYIDDQKLYPIVTRAVYNEIYYQYKKFRKNVRVQKTLSGIQYFTFIISDYENVCFTVNSDRTQINLIELPGIITAEKPLPELDEDCKMVYVNLSFSAKDNAYRINMYSSK